MMHHLFSVITFAIVLSALSSASAADPAQSDSSKWAIVLHGGAGAPPADATPEQLDAIKTDLARFCPIAKVIRGNGATITENWTTTPL